MDNLEIVGMKLGVRFGTQQPERQVMVVPVNLGGIDPIDGRMLTPSQHYLEISQHNDGLVSAAQDPARRPISKRALLRLQRQSLVVHAFQGGPKLAFNCLQKQYSCVLLG